MCVECRVDSQAINRTRARIISLFSPFLSFFFLCEKDEKRFRFSIIRIAWLSPPSAVVVVFLRLRPHHVRTHSQFNSSPKWVQKKKWFISHRCQVLLCSVCALSEYVANTHKLNSLTHTHGIDNGPPKEMETQHQQQDIVKYFSHTRPSARPPTSAQPTSTINERILRRVEAAGSSESFLSDTQSDMPLHLWHSVRRARWPFFVVRFVCLFVRYIQRVRHHPVLHIRISHHEITWEILVVIPKTFRWCNS